MLELDRFDLAGGYHRAVLFHRMSSVFEREHSLRHANDNRRSPGIRVGRENLAGEFLPEHRGIGRVEKSGFKIDVPCPNQFRYLAIKVLHTFRFTRLDGIQQSSSGLISMLDALARARILLHDFYDGYSAALVDSRHQPL